MLFQRLQKVQFAIPLGRKCYLSDFKNIFSNFLPRTNLPFLVKEIGRYPAHHIYKAGNVYMNRLCNSRNISKVTKCLISFCFFFVIPCDWCCPYCSDLAETRLKSGSPPLWLSVGQPAGTPLPLTSSQSDSVLVSQEIFLKLTQI